MMMWVMRMVVMMMVVMEMICSWTGTEDWILCCLVSETLIHTWTGMLDDT